METIIGGSSVLCLLELPGELPRRLVFSVHFLVAGACHSILSTHKWRVVTLLSYLYEEAYVIDVVCGSYFGVRECIDHASKQI